jgi:hypothetical protein
MPSDQGRVLQGGAVTSTWAPALLAFWGFPGLRCLVADARRQRARRSVP